MHRLVVPAIAALALLGACDNKKGPPPPKPTTAALEAVIAATPASDPSLPNAAEIAAAAPSDTAATR